LEKIFTKIGLLEWLKVKALSSSPSTYKKKRDSRQRACNSLVQVIGVTFLQGFFPEVITVIR
jgi:hypothetical protein